MNTELKQPQLDRDSDPRTYAIIGAAIEVHKQLGRGFLEAVYQEALAVELASRNVPFAREVELPILYKGLKLHTGYRADFVCYDTIILELKALRSTGVVEDAQLINYLKATKMHIGPLLNFGANSLEFKRFVH